MAMVNEELLTVKEVAARLKIHPETVRIWLRSRRVHGTAIGGKRLGWRVPESEVRRLIAEGVPSGTDGEGA